MMAGARSVAYEEVMVHDAGWDIYQLAAGLRGRSGL